MTIALLKLLLMGFACSTQGSSAEPPAEGPAGGPAAAAAAESAVKERPPRVVPVVVALKPPTPAGAFRYQTETIGIYTLLLEVGLMELHGVVVVTNGRPVSPGLAHPLGQAEATSWTAELSLGENPDAIEVELTLCTDNGKRCKSTSATGTMQNPEIAVSELLQFASTVLAREPVAGAVAQWKMPVSQDPYAVLICGRSAAAWYGLMDVPPEQELDKAKDPVVRAVILDPSMALAQWLLARRYAIKGNWDKAVPPFTAALEGRPLMPVFLADEAVVMESTRRELAAADNWESLLDAVPGDPRFLLAQVQTELHAGRLSQARTQLAALVLDWPADSEVAAARVQLADKSGEEQGVDDLLAHWAETDPKAFEPVRRRIQLRIRQGAYQDASSMLPELRARGASDLADSYEIPLGVALEDWETAASAAERVGSPDVATRIRARAKLESNPDQAPDLPPGAGAEGLLVLGRIALGQGDPTRAIEYAERADKLRPWDPDVLALLRDALEKQGKAALAQAVDRRIALAEPANPAKLVQSAPPVAVGQ